MSVKCLKEVLLSHFLHLLVIGNSLDHVNQFFNLFACSYKYGQLLNFASVLLFNLVVQLDELLELLNRLLTIKEDR